MERKAINEGIERCHPSREEPSDMSKIGTASD